MKSPLSFNQFSQRLKSLPLHPFLFAIYPALALLGFNIEQIRPTVALRAILLSLALAVVLFLLFQLFLKNWDAAAILTTAALLEFFSYGHVYNALKTLSLTANGLDRHRILAPLFLLAFIAFAFWLLRKKRDLGGVHAYLNLITAIALVFPVLQLVQFDVRAQVEKPVENAPDQAAANLHLPANGQPPDVYYIIVDAYSRDDTLLKEYGLDNTPFLNQLKDLGFYVARCSQSNYGQTELSLSSSLNMNYLDALDPHATPGSTDRSGLPELIKHSAMRRAFESLGYKTVAFETGFKITEWDDANLYLSPSSAAVGNLQVNAGLNDFELMLVNTSAGRLLTDGAKKLPQFLQSDFDNPRRIHRDLILYDFDQLTKLPALPGPKLVFAHMVIPHPPYVFGPNGEFTDYDREPKIAYRDQVQYLNKRLIPILRTIQQESATPPIIVIQGDHAGVEADQSFRMEIFNAYYLPGQAAGQLYESITPVNTFRLILDQYFGGQYKLLKDVSYFSAYKTPFDYTIMPNKRKGCPAQ
jgi:hypothetical protein